MFRVLNCLAVEHDWRLLVVAAIVCFLASLAAVNLFQRAQATRGRLRAAWILTAGTATGCGIWATHFIAMLAYDPGVAIAYNIGLLALSFVAVMVVTSGGLTLAVVTSARWAAPVAGAIVGAGLAGMHYIGMSAVEVPGRLTWWPHLVVVSIAIVILLSMIGLTIAVRRTDMRGIAAAALCLTLAIVSVHFIGMGAAEIVPDPTRAISAFSLSPNALAIVVAGVAVSIPGMALVGAFGDHHLNEKLREANLRLDAALNNMHRGLCMFDSEGRLVLCNERYIQMHRLSHDTVKPGCTIRELLELRKASGTFSGDPDEYSTNLRARIAEGKTFRSTIETADGRVTVMVNQPIEGGGWVATFEDVTERRRVEQERDRSQKFLNTILENAPIPIFVKEARGLRYVLVNRAGEKFWGTSRAEMIGKTSHDVFPKEEADRIAARDKQLLDSDQPIFDERQIQTPRNGIRNIVSRRLTVCDDDGKSRYLVGVIEDVTERKQVEKRIAHMANEVIHLNRIAIAGVLSTSFAHELNQPLGAILSNAEAAEVLLTANPFNAAQLKETIADIRRDDERAAEIIKQLGGLLKKGSEIELQEFDLNDAVRCALHFLDHEAETRGVMPSVNQVRAALPVRANVVHLQQVILNLAVNGMDAMASRDPGSRRLTLETALSGDADVEVSVSDSGAGIPPDKLERIFDTFVTTKPQGTGLGLSIARTIVETYGGKIWAENRLEGGAVFRFTLPLARTPAA
jgi:PAS domain S-box-containing protein